ncbi:MAG: phosphoesterase PA-phosphatase related protein, partial [Actinomycetia bacterium]|nr:phosphoesterase PA-phosphatase related protein [Actinomycetes bacterium]
MATDASGSAPHGHGLIFVNPAAGDDDGGVDDLREAFPGHRVRECEPADLANEVSRAKDGDLLFVGVAGGDGTFRCVAQEMVGGDVPLLAVPAGTRNHFARQLELVDFAAAVRAADGP